MDLSQSSHLVSCLSSSNHQRQRQEGKPQKRVSWDDDRMNFFKKFLNIRTNTKTKNNLDEDVTSTATHEDDDTEGDDFPDFYSMDENEAWKEDDNANDDDDDDDDDTSIGSLSELAVVVASSHIKGRGQHQHQQYGEGEEELGENNDGQTNCLLGTKNSLFCLDDDVINYESINNSSILGGSMNMPSHITLFDESITSPLAFNDSPCKRMKMVSSSKIKNKLSSASFSCKENLTKCPPAPLSLPTLLVVDPEQQDEAKENNEEGNIKY